MSSAIERSQTLSAHNGGNFDDSKVEQCPSLLAQTVGNFDYGKVEQYQPLPTPAKEHLDTLRASIDLPGLNRAAKRKRIEDRLKADSQVSDNTIAAMIGGCGSHLVARVREMLIARGEIKRHRSLRGKDGKYRVAKYSRITADSRQELEVVQVKPSEKPCEGEPLDAITAELEKESRQAADPEPHVQTVLFRI